MYSNPPLINYRRQLLNVLTFHFKIALLIYNISFTNVVNTVFSNYLTIFRYCIYSFDRVFFLAEARLFFLITKARFKVIFQAINFSPNDSTFRKISSKTYECKWLTHLCKLTYSSGKLPVIYLTFYLRTILTQTCKAQSYTDLFITLQTN